MATLKSIKNKYLSASDGDILGVTTNTENLGLLSFKLATADSLSKFNLVDGFSDDFNDANGVDSGNSTDQVRNSDGNYFAGTDAANYFGDGSLGNCTFGASSITQTADTTAIDTVLTTGSEAGGPGNSSYGTDQAGVSYVPNPTACYEMTVPSIAASYDGDMVLAQFKDLTIDASVTLTTKQSTRGMFVYVAGDCTINGALSMTARGAYANPTSSGGSDSAACPAAGMQIGMRTTGGSSSFTNDGTGFSGSGNGVRAAIANQGDISSNGTIYTITQAGGAGGTSALTSGRVPGNAGAAPNTTGITLSTGGGGGGGTGNWSSANSVGGRPGAVAAVWSGGSGGGGFSSSNNTYTTTPTAGTANGGPGGNAGRGPHGDARAGGGAGNPRGTGVQGNHCCGYPGDYGTGGIMWLVVQGNLTIGGSASIQANGGQGGGSAGTALESGGGGGAGGGAVHVLYAGALNNTGSITASGGSGGYGRASGGAGGAGGTNADQVLGLLYNDMTLQSESFTAQTSPITARIIIDEFTPVGTCVPGTDIQALVARDGTTFQAATLTEQAVISTVGGIDTYTKLMLHMDGSNAGTTFTDSSAAPHTVTAVGGAQTLTAKRRFGTASMYTSGNADSLSIPNSADFNFGNGDFSIDAWIYHTGTSGYQTIATGTNTSHSTYWQFRYFGADGRFDFWVTGDTNGVTFAPGSQLTLNTWNHLAISRNGNNWYGFVNGVKIGATQVNSFTITDVDGLLEIGGPGWLGQPFIGYIDEFRISKGIARWTASFTPPTQAYSDGELASRRLLSASHTFTGSAGTSMKYKILTLNQSTTKQTRVYGTSMAWA